MKSLVDSLIGTASYTSEPSFERTLLGQEGVEVRWQLPTFTLAARKFLATLITLTPLAEGDILVILGRDERLNVLETAVREEWQR